MSGEQNDRGVGDVFFIGDCCDKNVDSNGKSTQHNVYISKKNFLLSQIKVCLKHFLGKILTRGAGMCISPTSASDNHFILVILLIVAIFKNNRVFGHEHSLALFHIIRFLRR